MGRPMGRPMGGNTQCGSPKIATSKFKYSKMVCVTKVEKYMCMRAKRGGQCQATHNPTGHCEDLRSISKCVGKLGGF